MTEFFLTQAEMDALLEQNRRLDSLFDQELTQLLQGANYLLERHFSLLLGASVLIDGFYVERTTAKMTSTFIKSSGVCLFPVEFPLGSTYLMFQKEDAKNLAEFLNISLSRASNLFVEEFINVLSDFLTEQTGYWQQGTVTDATAARDSQIKTLTNSQSHIARYNICFNSSSIEVFWLIPGELIREKISLQSGRLGVKRREKDHKTMNAQRPKAVRVEPYEFCPLKVDESESSANSLDIVGDVMIKITAELGSTEMRLEEIMKLKIGDVITLEKAAGDPADVYVSDQNIARAEITVVDGHLGLRILAMDNLKDQIKY